MFLMLCLFVASPAMGGPRAKCSVPHGGITVVEWRALEETDTARVGGNVTARIRRTTIHAAELLHHSIVVLKDGEEVVQTTGDVAPWRHNTPHPVAGHWWNSLTAILPAGVRAPFQVSVVDSRLAVSCTFDVFEDGAVKRRRK